MIHKKKLPYCLPAVKMFTTNEDNGKSETSATTYLFILVVDVGYSQYYKGVGLKEAVAELYRSGQRGGGA